MPRIPFSTPRNDVPGLKSVRDELTEECDAMLAALAGDGRPINVPLGPYQGDGMPAGTTWSTEEMIKLHTQLAGLVSPATPRGLAVLQKEKDSRYNLFGSVPLVRWLSGGSLVIVLIMVVILVFTKISSTSGLNADHDSASNGERFLNAIFLLLAAGLGAAFNGLTRATRYINQGSFDSRLSGTYTTRIVLGVVAGFFLSEILSTAFDFGTLGLPLLAILGGFSADVVYKMLTKILESVQQLVSASSDEMVSQQIRLQQIQSAQQVTTARTQLATGLLSARTRVAADSPKAAAELDTLIASVLTFSPLDVSPPASRDGAAANDVPAPEAPVATGAPSPHQ